LVLRILLAKALYVSATTVWNSLPIKKPNLSAPLKTTSNLPRTTDLVNITKHLCNLRHCIHLIWICLTVCYHLWLTTVLHTLLSVQPRTASRSVRSPTTVSTGQHRYIYRRSAIQSAQMYIDRDFALLTTCQHWQIRSVHFFVSGLNQWNKLPPNIQKVSDKPTSTNVYTVTLRDSNARRPNNLVTEHNKSY